MGWRHLKFGLAVGIIGFIWLVALPMVASTPGISARLDWLDEQGVDPSAMYYTELDMMVPIFNRMALEERQ